MILSRSESRRLGVVNGCTVWYGPLLLVHIGWGHRDAVASGVSVFYIAFAVSLVSWFDYRCLTQGFVVMPAILFATEVLLTVIHILIFHAGTNTRRGRESFNSGGNTGRDVSVFFCTSGRCWA